MRTKDPIDENIKDMFDQIKKSIEVRKKDPYTFSALPEYLELDTWSIEEGLLLLSGICPDGADIEYEYKNYTGVTIKGTVIYNCVLLSKDDYFYTIPTARLIRDELYEAKSNLANSVFGSNEKDLKQANTLKNKITDLNKIIENAEVLNKEQILLEYENKLSRIKRLWESGEFKETRYPPLYFIEWAAKKNIVIEWLDWLMSKDNINFANNLYSILPETENLSIRKNQIHKERCRAIASMIWDNYPNRTIADVCVSNEITQHGCEGKVYAEDTIRGWIKDLHPNPKPGRPKNKN